jgi:hypothetical protein
MQYVKFIQKLFSKVEEKECINKQIEQYISLTNMKMNSLMEDRNNNLEEESKRLTTLSMQLESKLGDPLASKDLQNKVQTQQSIIYVFKHLAIVGTT